jgi:hypothetical protein
MMALVVLALDCDFDAASWLLLPVTLAVSA